jgi:putative FmdB family regulatory protein
MPLYEYECESCGHRFELIQRFADPPAEHCAACGKGPIHKLLSAPAIHFKGAGWYVTDYANKKSDGSPKTDPGAPTPDSSSKSDGSSKTDSGAPKSDGSSKTDGASKTDGSAKSDAASSGSPASSGDAKPAASESASAPAKDGGKKD